MPTVACLLELSVKVLRRSRLALDDGRANSPPAQDEETGADTRDRRTNRNEQALPLRVQVVDLVCVIAYAASRKPWCKYEFSFAEKGGVR